MQKLCAVCPIWCENLLQTIYNLMEWADDQKFNMILDSLQQFLNIRLLQSTGNFKFHLLFARATLQL